MSAALDLHRHVFVPAPACDAGLPPPRTLLLLHGTGGDERDLLPLGRALDPAAALLSPRGNALEHGMPRYFRRLREGVFDEADVLRRADDLARWLGAAAAGLGFAPESVVAVGYSNGANIAAAVMLTRPGLIRRGVLLRAMPPLAAPTATRPNAGDAVVLSGAADPIATPDHAATLTAQLLRAGYAATHEPTGTTHGLTEADVTRARSWLASAAPR